MKTPENIEEEPDEPESVETLISCAAQYRTIT